MSVGPSSSNRDAHWLAHMANTKCTRAHGLGRGVGLSADIHFFLYIYICIENRWTFFRIFGVATAQLCPRLFNSPRGRFLARGRWVPPSCASQVCDREIGLVKVSIWLDLVTVYLHNHKIIHKTKPYFLDSIQNHT